MKSDYKGKQSKANSNKSSYLHHSNSWINLWRQRDMNLILVSVNTAEIEYKCTLPPQGQTLSS